MSGGGGHLCELQLQYQTTGAFLPWNASGHLYSDTDPHAARDHGSCFRFMYLQEKGGSYALHMFLTILFQVCPEWGPGLPGVNRFQDGSTQIVAGVVSEAVQGSGQGACLAQWLLQEAARSLGGSQDGVKELAPSPGLDTSKLCGLERLSWAR